jgi:hypothetical protein
VPCCSPAVGPETLESVTVPLDRGLELSVILEGDLPDA